MMTMMPMICAVHPHSEVIRAIMMEGRVCRNDDYDAHEPSLSIAIEAPAEGRGGVQQNGTMFMYGPVAG